VLDTLLLENAVTAGATDFQETTVEGFFVHGTGVRIETRRERHREYITARMLVGADGLHSRIAHRLGVARAGARRRVALVAHAADVRGMTDIGEMHVARGAYVGLAPIGHDVTNVSVVQDTMRDAGGKAEQRFARAIARFPDVADRLATSRRVSPVRAAGPFARWTSRATADRTLLVGDAADFYDPFTGEGIYAALHGAELASQTLMNALEHGAFGARALRGYDRARRRAFGGKWILERVIASLISSPALFNRISRRLAQRPVLADLLVGVTGDFVPTRSVLSPSFLWQLAR
jgi:flavin-dependent dehydrogenase